MQQAAGRQPPHARERPPGRPALHGRLRRARRPRRRQAARSASSAVGHVILFARNVADPEQVADLVRELQAAARDAGHDLPLLIARRPGRRPRRAAAGSPGRSGRPLRALGRIGSRGPRARGWARRSPRSCAPCGIRCDFAPVVDVDTNPKNPIIGDRSFGDDPDLVGAARRRDDRGAAGGGVAACAKHFPGTATPTSTRTSSCRRSTTRRSRLDEVELRPFRARDRGGRRDDHDGARPGARARRRELPGDAVADAIVDGMLRKELELRRRGRDGRPRDEGGRDRWGRAESAVLAVQAGCDLLPVCNEPRRAGRGDRGARARAASRERSRSRAMDDAVAPDPRAEGALPRCRYRDPDPKQARLAAADARSAWRSPSEIARARRGSRS